jgi:hypothetical protein
LEKVVEERDDIIIRSRIVTFTWWKLRKERRTSVRLFGLWVKILMLEFQKYETGVAYTWPPCSVKKYMAGPTK